MIDLLYKYKKITKALIFILLLLSTLFMLNNKLQYEITQAHGDDVHTMNYGISSMYTGEVSTLRVGESTRWLARIIYPVALYYMNSNMGGEHYVTGWGYPSGFYIKKHFKNPASVKDDPNIQDFVFAMKFILGTLVILSFLVASYMLTITYGYIAGISYFIFSMSTSLIGKMFSVFYTESTLIIILNLIIVLGLMKKLNIWRLYIWLAFLFAFAVSTKLTGLVFILPILAIIISKDKNMFKNMKVEGFIFLSILFFLLLNIFASSYMSLLDQTLANVYHLKTGHFNTVPSGHYQFKLILKALSPWIYIFVVAMLYLIYRKFKNKSFTLALGISALIMIVALIGVSFYLSRNLTTPLIIMIFIISIGLSIFIYSSKKLNKHRRFTIVGFILLLLVYHTYNIKKHTVSITPNLILSSIKSCKNIATIDIEGGIINNSTVLASMPNSFTLKKQQQSFLNQFLPYDCVVVKKVKNNKHYTNYLLPLDYKLITRYGKYFVFKNEDRYKLYKSKKKELNEKISQLKNYKKIFSSKFDIYKIDNKLILYKEKCTSKDIHDTFFLHVTPYDNKDLPVERQKHKFDNLDFKVNEATLLDGKCYIEKELPEYKYKSIGIGQYNKSGRSWSEAIGEK